MYFKRKSKSGTLSALTNPPALMTTPSAYEVDA